MKIAIAVHGRFHAFHLARALDGVGQDVTLLTNYPKWAVRRFGVGAAQVRSFWQHGVLTKSLDRTDKWGFSKRVESWTHPMFGQWIFREVMKSPFDVVHMFSGVAEELLLDGHLHCRLTQIVRGSAHIRYQDELLREEEERCGARLDRPTEWMIEREEREYALADQIVVLSTFARNSFLRSGVAPEKLRLVPLGVGYEKFRPNREMMEARIRRIEGGCPLRVLTTGNISLQKGLADYVEAVRVLAGSPFEFSIVGNVTADSQRFFDGVRDLVCLRQRVFENQLPEVYAEHDVFLLPTIHDGFAAVLAQASANGMPVITTANCSGPDIVEDGRTGWIVPIRRADQIVEKLTWCHEHRAELAEMAMQTTKRAKALSWEESAHLLLQSCEEGLADPGAMIRV